MEFHENRANQPFIGYVLLARSLKRVWLHRRNRRDLQQVNNEPPKTAGKRQNDSD
ncbi:MULTISPECIES: DUF1127 domain-containing protein [Tatumella]|uniref:Uncharacterized protein n=1 Tax=Tatumella ptyseos ATCC 33301 TaxID=1005995 RepID=A0A085J9K7_9GAMM|nr:MULTISPECIES: DUF1127 domain-containing protein [Tatumella]KFD17153.1 hypothetical protein GTPT_3282 [Tatumella ptyseos ATCC 33301]